MKLRFALTCAASLTVALLLSGTAWAQAITRGAPLGDSPVVNVSDVLRDVDAYVGATVTLEGSVEKVCHVKGCWMELVPADRSAGIRVTFKNYGFFVPTDSTGYRARLEGMFETNVFSKDDADHLIAEGVDLLRNPDGSATEVSFVAAGVELRQ